MNEMRKYVIMFQIVCLHRWLITVALEASFCDTVVKSFDVKDFNSCIRTSLSSFIIRG